MFKRTIAAIAVAGSLFVLAPHAAFAGEAPSRPVSPTEQPTTDAKRDAVAQKALQDLERRVAGDPVLARQLQASAARGDTAQATRLLAPEGAEVVAIGTDGGDMETARVTITVRITVCVRIRGRPTAGPSR